MSKTSKYNLIESFEWGAAFFNTRTGAVITVPNKVVSLLNTKAGIDSIGPKTKALLEKVGVIVDEEVDETAAVISNYQKGYFQKDRLNITILPVEKCNLTCQYCFIYEYGGGILSDALANGIIAFIERKVADYYKTETGHFRLTVNWYGGEPLLNQRRILDMMGKIDSFRKRWPSLVIKASIVTNGCFLNYRAFKRLIEKGVSTYQITFDGGEKFHNQTRKDRSGKGSFSLIISNLEEIKKECGNARFKMAIRINFMKSSLPSVRPLIDRLSQIIQGDERFSVYCRQVCNFETTRDSINEIKDDIFALNEGLLIQESLNKYAYLKIWNRPVGINQSIPTPKTSWCSEDNGYSYIIGANGLIYRCDTLVGNKKYAVGKIGEDGTALMFETNKEWFVDIFSLGLMERCTKCTLLPLCMGGCRRNHIENPENPCFFNEKIIRNQLRDYYGKRHNSRKEGKRDGGI